MLMMYVMLMINTRVRHAYRHHTSQQKIAPVRADGNLLLCSLVRFAYAFGYPWGWVGSRVLVLYV